MKSLLNKHWTAYIGMGLIAILVIRFIYFTFYYSTNIPFAFDDTHMYVTKYIKLINKDASFFEQLEYLFSVSVFPHTKFVGRLISLISYNLGFGVNYQLLKILGNLTLLSIPFILFARSNLKNILHILPIVILILAPLRTNFWIGPITGYPFLYLLVFYCYWNLSKSKILFAGLLAFIASFTHSPGLTVFVYGYLIILVNNFKDRPKLFKQIGIWTILFISSISIYYSLVIVNFDNFQKVDRFESHKWSLDRIISLVNYIFNFIAIPTADYKIPNFVKQFNSFGLLVLIAYTTFIQNFASLKKNLPWIAFMLFSFGPAGLSALSNDDPTRLNEIVAPRYVMYAMLIWVTSLFYITNALFKANKKILLSIIVIFYSALFIPYYTFNSDRADTTYHATRFYWGHRLTSNKNSVKGVHHNNKKEGKIYNNAIDIGMYVPRLKDFSPIKESEIEEINNERKTNNIYISDFSQSKKFLTVEWIFHGQNFDKISNMEIHFDNLQGSQKAFKAEELNNSFVRHSFSKDLKEKFGIKRPANKFKVYRFFVPKEEIFIERGNYKIKLKYNINHAHYSNQLDKTINYFKVDS